MSKKYRSLKDDPTKAAIYYYLTRYTSRLRPECTLGTKADFLLMTPRGGVPVFVTILDGMIRFESMLLNPAACFDLSDPDSLRLAGRHLYCHIREYTKST